MKKDHRQPWYLLEKKDEKTKPILINGTEKQIILSKTELRKIDSELLIGIDNNDVQSVESAIAKDTIDINKMYMIPYWEVPEASEMQFQTFLHRALYDKSSDVFELLLRKGANPRIEDYRRSTVIDDLFDSDKTKEDVLKYGKMLIDYGVTAEEIKSAAENRSKKHKQSAKMLIDYAKTGKIASQQKEINLSLEHIRN